ncbi:MAG: response regulator [Rhodospirillales bacterium]|nr:response regulator [Rhodospirillales bacterium]
MTPETHVLIVDDDPQVREIVRDAFEAQGWAAAEAADSLELADRLRRCTPDLILLDLCLPDADGLAIASKLRLTSDVPIIILTGLGADIDRIVGLEIGADDYVVKPFNPRELVARAKAVLRRSRGPMGGTPSVPALGHDCRRFVGYLLDLTTRRLIAPDGTVVPLTNAEFLLLEAFISAPRRVLSRDQLLELTRSHGGDVFDRTIDVLVLRLRRKIEANPHAPRLIRTERGAGYVFDTVVESI